LPKKRDAVIDVEVDDAVARDVAARRVEVVGDGRERITRREPLAASRRRQLHHRRGPTPRRVLRVRERDQSLRRVDLAEHDPPVGASDVVREPTVGAAGVHHADA
jgi:hypothetical protein